LKNRSERHVRKAKRRNGPVNSCSGDNTEKTSREDIRDEVKRWAAKREVALEFKGSME
jgi:hypothetical protein